MEVWEKINYLIAEKKISKKDFIDRLLALKPTLKSTGEIPSFTTINGYIYNAPKNPNNLFTIHL